VHSVQGQENASLHGGVKARRSNGLFAPVRLGTRQVPCERILPTQACSKRKSPVFPASVDQNVEVGFAGQIFEN